MAALTYAESGVDRIAADRLVEKISILSKKTLNKRVKSSVGGYASLFELDKKRWIAASTDGVGTKLKLAFRLKEHRTVGIDLVAMSVNDLLCVGAEPLFFLDYFATGRLEPSVGESVLTGIVEGCKQAGCALVGGETAEMPDFYTQGEYDLAGFAVGIVDAKKALPRKDVQAGDALIGIRSSGCHSNGYSLLRRMLPEGQDGDPLALELLTPTRIYTKAVLPLIQKNLVKGMAHITGSGFLNVPRISEKVSYDIQLPPPLQRPAVFEWVRTESGLPFEELAQTFNLGIGMVLAVSPRKTDEVLRILKKAGEKAWEIGQVIPKRKSKKSQVLLRDRTETVVLTY
ncbi:MAG: phosphoribosylformylglycinamidine cyclo-ligase [Bdellovibrio sp.]|nr:phosphoribosylformylglycinamidine cyclo-ligase [Bdellovibrio sp.]